MNTTILMDNLLSLIHSMALSASNKQWLADHLYEEVRSETAAVSVETPVRKTRKLQIDPRVKEMFKGASIPKDFDEKKAYADYLCEKYR